MKFFSFKHRNVFVGRFALGSTNDAFGSDIRRDIVVATSGYARSIAKAKDDNVTDQILEFKEYSRANLRKLSHLFPPNLTGTLAAFKTGDPHDFSRTGKVLLVNGFGTNIGDNILGSQALRAIGDQGPKENQLDVLLSPTAPAVIRTILSSNPVVDRVFQTALPLGNFLSYDAYIDFDELLRMPGFGTMSHVDFYITSLGADPASIHESQKRNCVQAKAVSLFAMREVLEKLPRPLCLFNWAASVALRSIPRNEAVRLAQEILEADPTINLILSMSLPIHHERCYDLSNKIKDGDDYLALCKLVDSVITVDTAALHIADSADIPTCLISTATPLTYFPYYPFMKGFVPGKMPEMKGWNKPKLSADDWLEVEKGYEEEWQKVSGTQLIELVTEAAVIKDQPVPSRGSPPNQTARDNSVTTVSEQPLGLLRTPTYEKAPRGWERAAGWLTAVVRQRVRVGSTSFICGAASGGQLALEAARKCGPDGSIIVMEPRDFYAQLVAANWVANDITWGRVFCAIPGSETATGYSLHWLDPHLQHSTGLIGNTQLPKQNMTMAIDELEESRADLIVIQPPIPVEACLLGSQRTIEKCRPLIAAGPFSLGTAELVKNSTINLSYETYVRIVEQDSVGEYEFIISVPAGSSIKIRGLHKVT